MALQSFVVNCLVNLAEQRSLDPYDDGIGDFSPWFIGHTSKLHIVL